MSPSASGIAAHRGKGMGIAIADYDHDGRMDIFVANDTLPNFLFHNEGGGRFRETALQAGVGLNDDGKALSSMGVDFRDLDNDGWEDLVDHRAHPINLPGLPQSRQGSVPRHYLPSQSGSSPRR